MRFRRPTFNQLLLVIVLLVSAALIGLTVYQPAPEPQAIHVFPDSANIYFATDRTQVLFSDDCVTLIWHIYGTQHITINGYDRHPDGEETWCGVTPRLETQLANGSTFTHTFSRQAQITAVSRATLNWVLGATVGLLLIVWLYRVRFMWWPRWRAGVAHVRRVWLGGIVQAARADGWPLMLGLGLVLAIGLGLRLAYLHEPMRYDEAFTYVKYASQPVEFLLSDYNEPNNHIFYTLQVHITTRLLGNAPWTIRLPALIHGLLLIVMTYVAGRALYQPLVGLLAAGVLAIHPVFVLYAVNGRGYTLLVLFFITLMVVAHYLNQHPRQPMLWLGFILCGAFGFHTIPIMLYPFGAVCVWLGLAFLTRENAAERKRAVIYLVGAGLATGLLAGVLYMPVFLKDGVQAVTGNNFVKSLGWQEFVEGLQNTVSLAWKQWNRDLLPGLPWLLVLGFGVGVGLHRRLSSGPLPVAVTCLLWIIPVLLIQQVYGIGTRVWIFLIPLYAITAAGGLVFIARQLRLSPVLLVGSIVFLIAGNALYIVERQAVRIYEDNAFSSAVARDAQTIMRFISDTETPGQEGSIVFIHWTPELPYYATYYNKESAVVLWPRFPRLYLVVGKNGTPEQFIENADIDPAQYTDPQLLAEFEHTRLYEIRAKAP